MWIPINNAIPAERIIEMLDMSEATILLYETDLPKEIYAWAVESGTRLVSIDEVCEPREEFLSSYDENAVAYIMFTSGSTGTPKGVPMTFRNITPFIENFLSILPLKVGDVFSDYHDFGFDLSVFYLFAFPLVHGAISPGIKEAERLMPAKHIVENKITVLSSVPAILSRLRLQGKSGVRETQVRIVFMCGEPFRLDLLQFCYEEMNFKHVYNFYGLTETGVENFHHKCKPSDVEVFSEMGFVPIGQALPHSNVLVGADDELLISGPQVMQEYLGDMDGDRFIEIEGTRWFKTGDRVALYEGEYFCKGRLDNQVKVSGYRIELSDIEAQLRKNILIKEAVCFVVGETERRFIVAACLTDADVDSEMVKADLRKTLPEYMIPRDITWLAEIPLNKNGKIDRVSIKASYEISNG